jgi:tRNA A-37 threonylcarbamoyl transferase component Bud32
MLSLGAGRSGLVHLSNSGTAVKTFTNRTRYQREKRFLADNATRLRGIIQMISFDDTSMSIELPYIQHTLEMLLIQKQCVSKLHVLQQIAQFLSDCKRFGIAHNDFKAKNILIGADMMSAIIIDFETATNTDNHANDLKRFKFIVLQMLFDSCYADVYHKYTYFVNRTLNPPVFQTPDIDAMYLQLPSLLCL